METNFKTLLIPANRTSISLINSLVGTALSILLSCDVTLSKGAETNWGNCSISQRSGMFLSYWTDNALFVYIFSRCIPQQTWSRSTAGDAWRGPYQRQEAFQRCPLSEWISHKWFIGYTNITVSVQIRKVLLKWIFQSFPLTALPVTSECGFGPHQLGHLGC